MASLRVTVMDAAGSRRNTAELPDDVPMSRLVPALVSRMGLPATNPEGQPVTRHLHCKRLGRNLRPDETLADAAIQPDEEMRFVDELIAGG